MKFNATNLSGVRRKGIPRTKRIENTSMPAALDSQIRERIIDLIDEGIAGKKIAQSIGCSTSTVSRIRHPPILRDQRWAIELGGALNDQIIGHLRNAHPHRWMAVLKSMHGAERIDWLNGIADAALALAEQLFASKYENEKSEANDPSG